MDQDKLNEDPDGQHVGDDDPDEAREPDDTRSGDDGREAGTGSDGEPVDGEEGLAGEAAENGAQDGAQDDAEAGEEARAEDEGPQGGRSDEAAAGDVGRSEPRVEPRTERATDETHTEEPEPPAAEERGREPTGGHRAARSGAAAGAGAAFAGDPHPGEDLAGDSFGAWLRRQREMREIDLREVAEQTKISLRYLKAMEQDRFDVLPAPVFARGFLREYARYVGLNPDEVVNYYLSSHEKGDGEDTTDSTSVATESRGPVSARLLIALLLLLILAAAAYVWFYQQSQEEGSAADDQPPMAAPARNDLEPPPPEPVVEPDAAMPSAPLVVTLDFTQKCWVEARADEQRRVSRLFAAGESLQLEANEQVVLETLGNVAGVRVQVNGEPYELPEARGNSVRDVVIPAPRPAPRGGPRAGGATQAQDSTDGAATPGTPPEATPPATQPAPQPVQPATVQQPTEPADDADGEPG